MLTKRERLAKWRRKLSLTFRPKVGAAKPLFVFGTQRSGTNMTMHVLGQCPQTEVYLENDDEAFVQFRLRPEEQIKKIVHSSRAKVCAFKPITDSQNARMILENYENSVGLWVFRHFDDVVNSSLRNFTDHQKYLYNMLHEPDPADWRLENVPEATLKIVQQYCDRGISDASAAALAWWIRNEHYFLQKLEKHENLLLAKYEDMVQQPTSTFMNIFRFAGLSFNSKYVARIFSSSIGKHPQQEIDFEIRNICHQTFDRLNKVKITQLAKLAVGP